MVLDVMTREVRGCIVLSSKEKKIFLARGVGVVSLKVKM